MAFEVKLSEMTKLTTDYIVQQKNKCLMIVNTSFVSRNPLPGYNVDVCNFRKVLEHYNFEVTIFKNLRGGSILPAVDNYLEGNTFHNDDCVAFAIFTHGLDQGKLLGVDDETVNVYSIVSLYTDKNEFLAKPKLFFIQACRGHFSADVGDVTIRASGVEQRVQQADIFIFFSTFPQFKSWVDDKYGSFFMQALCKALQEYGNQLSLQEIATKVNQILSTHVVKSGITLMCQVSECCSTLTYNVYLMSNGSYPTNADKGNDVAVELKQKTNLEASQPRTRISLQNQKRTTPRQTILVSDGRPRRKGEQTKLATKIEGLICRNNINELQILLSANDFTNERDGVGFTPLHYAAKYNKEQIFNILCQNGCDVNSINDFGWTVLHSAVWEDSIDVVSVILQKYPHLVNVEGYWGDLPYSEAKKHRCKRTVGIFDLWYAARGESPPKTKFDKNYCRWLQAGAVKGINLKEDSDW